MTKWYRVSTYHKGIEEFEVVKETTKQLVYIQEDGWTGKSSKRRALKSSQSEKWFLTLAEAVDYKHKNLLSRLEGARDEYQRREDDLKLFEAVLEEGGLEAFLRMEE